VLYLPFGDRACDNQCDVSPRYMKNWFDRNIMGRVVPADHQWLRPRQPHVEKGMYVANTDIA
jgi:hypothetical protein